jgi:hypothetical protein
MGISMRQKILSIATASIVTLAGGTSAAEAPAGVKNALSKEYIGLLPAGSFQLRSGTCADCAVPKQNLWYFENELIAVPASATAAAGFSKGSDRNKDVATWAATPEAGQLAHPSLVWIGAPSILEGATILPGAQRVRTAAGQELDFRLATKLSTNRSYANDATSTSSQAVNCGCAGPSPTRPGKRCSPHAPLA